MTLPDNHASNFPAEWWNERRKCDYFVDDECCVQLRHGSETGLKVKRRLNEIARDLALSMTPAQGSA